MRIENPFHHGELEAQRLAGESAIALRNSVVIADKIISGALAFLSQQRMIVLATLSASGSLWASPVFGIPGFVTSSDGRHVHIDRSRLRASPGDPLWQDLSAGAHVGLLAIEFATRRRLRVNGTIRAVDPAGLEIHVLEAYPNCPKYIQPRGLHFSAGISEADHDTPISGQTLPSDVEQVVEGADTLFIASTHPVRGTDVSHRGGRPGFIERVDGQTLRIPDYAGNSLFNTFGNLLVTPGAGVTVMNFDRRAMLQMTGEVSIEWNQSDPDGLTGGTGRFWTFRIHSWRLNRMPPEAHWRFLAS